MSYLTPGDNSLAILLMAKGLWRFLIGTCVDQRRYTQEAVERGWEHKQTVIRKHLGDSRTPSGFACFRIYNQRRTRDLYSIQSAPKVFSSWRSSRRMNKSTSGR